MKDNNETYAITDIRGYRSMIAKAVADDFGAKDPVEVFEYITPKQMEQVIEEECLGHTEEENFFLINEDAHCNILNKVISLVQSSLLSKMAANGQLECAWDEKENDMIFLATRRKQDLTLAECRL